MDTFIGLIVIVFVMASILGSKKAKDKKEQNVSMPQTGNRTIQAAKPAWDAVKTEMHSHYSAAMPTQKPIPVTPMPPVSGVQMAMDFNTSGSLDGGSTEGMELHGDGFHGGSRLEKVDLGQLRAQENVHTAANLLWKPPEETGEYGQKEAGTQASVTAEQLRQTFILKEILDAPVSRRQGVRNRYGR